MLVHIGNRDAFPLGGHILDQLKDLMDRSIMVDGRHLQFKLYDCHNLACSYSLVTRGKHKAIGKSFCPWYMATNNTSLTTVAIDDIISPISKRYSLQETLVRELNHSLRCWAKYSITTSIVN